MVDQHRLPMGSISTNVGASASHVNGKRIDGNPHSFTAINHFEQPVLQSQLSQPSQKGKTSLPGFTEVFGPREALPPPKPAEARRTLLPTSPLKASAEVLHGTKAANDIPAPTKIAMSQDQSQASLPSSKKRRSDSLEEPVFADGLLAEPRPVSKKAKKSAAADTADLFDVSGVQLAGESSDSVPVFDTCDTIRRKIRAFLTKPGVTQAAFLRAIAATCSDGRKFQGAQLNRFLSMKGATQGNTSGVFYAAYVFFEKVRIRDGKAKSADRLEMERQHPEGFNVTEVRNRMSRERRLAWTSMGRCG